jgi:hypothetical protein
MRTDLLKLDALLRGYLKQSGLKEPPPIRFIPL